MPETANKAVFLSYASQDAEAARRICDALRAAGVEVWFDQSELRGGDAWDQKIRRQIKECALFVPVISANTQARHEGYFRREWKLAVDRTHDMADHVAFLVPVVIDATRDADAFVPEKFREVQWTKAPDGETPTVFTTRVKNLLGGSEMETGRPRPAQRDPFDQLRVPSPSRDEGVAPPVTAARTPRWLRPALVSSIVVIVALGVTLWNKFGRESGAANATLPMVQKPAAPLSEARQLVAKAWEQMNKAELGRSELDAAEELCKQALSRDPNDANTWAASAQVDSWFVYFDFQDTPERREAARTKAARAMQIDPMGYEPRLALAAYHTRAWGTRGVSDGAPEAERLLRELLRERPSEPRALLTLALLQRNTGRLAESYATFRQVTENPAFAALAWNELGWAQYIARDLVAAETSADRSIALQPYWGNLSLKLHCGLAARGDLDQAKRILEQMPPAFFLEDYSAVMAWNIYYIRREPAAALHILNNVPRDWLSAANGSGPRAGFVAMTHEMAGHEAAARTEYGAALKVVERRLAENPSSPLLLRWKARFLVHLGQRTEAAGLFRSVWEMEGSTNPISEFYDLVLLDRPDEAMALLERVDLTQLSSLQRVLLRFNPTLDPLQKNPRFLALLAKIEATQRAQSSAAGPAAVAKNEAHPTDADPKSVAVLPFANLSGDLAQEYFSDGLTEEILNALARERDLRVVPRTSAFSFKGKNLPLPEIAKTLNVAQVVEGSVQRAGNRVRILCRLTRVADGYTEALPPFDRNSTDLFALEDEVARAVVEKLTNRATTAVPAGGTTNMEAYDRFLRARARQLRNATGPSGYAAMREYEEVLRLDPTFALAWAKLAEVAAGLGNTTGGFDMSEATRHRAIEAAGQAVRLAPNLAEAHVARAVVCLTVEEDFAEAGRELAAAERLQPLNADLARVRVSYEARTASSARLVELAMHAVELDPQNPSTLVTMGILLWRSGSFAPADDLLRRATDIGESQNAFLARGRNWAAWTGDIGHAIEIVLGCPEESRNELFYRLLAPLYEQAGDEALAVATWRKARAMAEKEIQTPGIRAAHAEILGELGRHLAQAGDSPSARKCFDDANAELDALLQEQPRNFNLIMRRSRLLAAESDFTDALSALENVPAGEVGAKTPAAGNLTGIATWSSFGESKARLLAALGKVEPAVEQLRELQAQGRAFGYTLRLTPEFKSLRASPAFQALMRDAEAQANAMPHPKE